MPAGFSPPVRGTRRADRLPRVEIYDELAAEEVAFDDLLSRLSPADWHRDSACGGWSVADVVLHLAQCEEAVVATLAGRPFDWRAFGGTVESAMDAYVGAERASGETVVARWRAARVPALAAFRAADPSSRITWVEGTMRPASLATTRLAEHWTHGLDIADPLGLPYPDTERLRHVAWLAHATLPYAYGLRGETAPSLRCELTGPGGAAWEFGPSQAEVTVRGSAADFCRVAAQRLDVAQAELRATGDRGAEVLARLRSYAA